jgi:hypothetical protein
MWTPEATERKRLALVVELFAGRGAAPRQDVMFWCAMCNQRTVKHALRCKSKPKKVIYKEHERRGLRKKAKKASQGPVWWVTSDARSA